MKKLILLLSVSLASIVLANGQTTHSSAAVDASSQTTASASRANRSVTLDSGTQLSGQLQNTIDARQARVGDPVVLKTTQAIKSNGRTVVSKGSRLIGHVTEVAQKTQNNGESRIGVLFDRLEQGTLKTPIVANITSITRASANANAGAHDDDMFSNDANMSGSARSTTSTRSSSGGSGGLLGGVVNSTTSTVGSVVGGATSAVGSTVNSTTGATSSLGRSLGGIQISQSSDTSVEGSSVLSLQGGNVHLEKGTNFNLVLTQSATVGTGRN